MITQASDERERTTLDCIYCRLQQDSEFDGFAHLTRWGWRHVSWGLQRNQTTLNYNFDFHKNIKGKDELNFASFLAMHLTLSSGKGERSFLAVWSCEGPRRSVRQKIFYYRVKNILISNRVLCVYYILSLFFCCCCIRKNPSRGKSCLIWVLFMDRFCVHTMRSTQSVCLPLPHSLVSPLSHPGRWCT